jgi:hypothetical protein
MARYKDVVLCADIMFINSTPYLITVSRHLRFGTTTKLESKSSKTVTTQLLKVIKTYRGGGFSVKLVATDNEFNYMRGDLAECGVLLNETSADEHVGEIERFIRTIKERVRATYNALPFRKIPGKLVTEMVNAGVYWWNSFPGNSGVSDCLSPGEIVLRRGLDYHKHCQLEFGEYVQTHEATDNSMAPRTVGALALRPNGNAQGGHLFYSLASGKVLNRNHWTPLPMPQEVIDRVTLLAGDAPPGLTFLDRLQEIVGDDPLVMEFFQDGDLAGVDLAGLEPTGDFIGEDEGGDPLGQVEEDPDFGQGNDGADSEGLTLRQKTTEGSKYMRRGSKSPQKPKRQRRTTRMSRRRPRLATQASTTNSTTDTGNETADTTSGPDAGSHMPTYMPLVVLMMARATATGPARMVKTAKTGAITQEKMTRNWLQKVS